MIIRKIITLAFIYSLTLSSMTLFANNNLGEKTADIILIGQSIITMDSSININAVAVAGRKIVATGSYNEVIKLKGKSTKIIELGDNTLVPGFIEHHVHPFLAAITMQSEIIAIEDWILPNKKSKGVIDRKSYLKRLRKAVEQFEGNEPLVTWGFHHYFHGKLSRKDLDSISPEKP
ncbi:MAG: amidohydrolase, partial [Gammaproteobacteria bacterium]|nr:amidohydrolase [Gammaproteobacteria bacterium]